MKKFLKVVILVLLILGVLEGVLRLVNLKANRVVRQVDYFAHLNLQEDLPPGAVTESLGQRRKGRYKVRSHMPPHNYFYVTYNKFRFRGKEFPLQKKDNTFRILCLGDSAMFGWGVDDSQTLSVRLEEILERELPDRKIEVINAAIPGSSLAGILKYLNLNDLLTTLQPDLIIANYMQNDVIYHGSMLTKQRVKKLPMEFVYYLDKSEIFLTLRSLLSFILIKGGVISSQMLLAKETPYSPKSFKKNLESFYNICSNYGVSLIYITTPPGIKFSHPFFKPTKDLWDRYEASILEAAKNKGFLYLDFKPELEGYLISQRERLKFERELNWTKCFPFNGTPFLIRRCSPLFIDVSHLSPLGNELVAKRLSKEIVRRFEDLKTE